MSITQFWRRLHNEEIHSLYRLTNIVRLVKSRRLRWVGHVATMAGGMSAFNMLTGTPTGNNYLGSPRRGFEKEIRIHTRN